MQQTDHKKGVIMHKSIVVITAGITLSASVLAAETNVVQLTFSGDSNSRSDELYLIPENAPFTYNDAGFAIDSEGELISTPNRDKLSDDDSANDSDLIYAAASRRWVNAGTTIDGVGVDVVLTLIGQTFDYPATYSIPSMIDSSLDNDSISISEGLGADNLLFMLSRNIPQCDIGMINCNIAQSVTIKYAFFETGTQTPIAIVPQFASYDLDQWEMVSYDLDAVDVTTLAATSEMKVDIDADQNQMSITGVGSGNRTKDQTMSVRFYETESVIATFTREAPGNNGNSRAAFLQSGNLDLETYFENTTQTWTQGSDLVDSIYFDGNSYNSETGYLSNIDSVVLTGSVTEAAQGGSVTITENGAELCTSETIAEDLNWRCVLHSLSSGEHHISVLIKLDKGTDTLYSVEAYTIVVAADSSEKDSDNDGISDQNEGNGDTDDDGIADYLDNDSDNDGVPDSLEGNNDTDNDGIADYQDLDSDNDGIPDRFETGLSGNDTDQDGIDDDIDVDQTNGNDTNNDGIDDLALLTDSDDDGIPNWIDQDSDNDGRPDAWESGLGTSDVDNDQIVDQADPDFIAGGIDENGDGIEDSTVLTDTDNDGIPDYLDNDSDSDGIPDADENGAIGRDSDGDSIDDAFDFDVVSTLDAECTDENTNGIADDCLAIDSDNDGILDSIIDDLDTDGDQLPDYQDADNTSDGDGKPTETTVDNTNPDGKVRVSIATGSAGTALLLLLPLLGLRTRTPKD
jgi:hypothetical protein